MLPQASQELTDWINAGNTLDLTTEQREAIFDQCNVGQSERML
jgi:hypothetical protein